MSIKGIVTRIFVEKDSGFKIVVVSVNDKTKIERYLDKDVLKYIYENNLYGWCIWEVLIKLSYLLMIMRSLL